MTHQAFNHIQMHAMRLAVDRLVDEMGEGAEKHRLNVARLVFNLGASTGVFDADALTEIARERLALDDAYRIKLKPETGIVAPALPEETGYP